MDGAFVTVDTTVIGCVTVSEMMLVMVDGAWVIVATLVIVLAGRVLVTTTV